MLTQTVLSVRMSSYMMSFARKEPPLSRKTDTIYDVIRSGE